MTRTLFIILALLSSLTLSARTTKAEADTLYSQHHYAEAAKAYSELLKGHPHDVQLLYNIGNCYYRLKDIPHAILAIQPLNP